jgi:DNA-binding Lrp family transcriptional regulator
MPAELNESDRRLLDQLQRELPLVEEPFREIGDRIEMSEQQVLDRVRALSGKPPAPIRQISAIFDSRALGYQSCLVAAKVDAAHIDHAAAIISGHPGVSHNYQREHEYNLWFTLAVSPDSQLGLERTAELLRELSGADQMRLLPSLKMYKIGVRFDLGGDTHDAPAANTRLHNGAAAKLDDSDKRIVRVLQQHLPITARPFDMWAMEAFLTPGELLTAARRYIDQGIMRRFSAVLRHREVGVSANAMGVWIVPPQHREEFGAIASANPAVSHCYLRPTYEDWPYSIFTMVHGKTRVDCEAALAEISLAGRVKDYTSLYSTVEYKKSRVRYFVGDVEQWESDHAGSASAISRR